MQPSPAEIAIRDELHCEFEMHGVRIAVESSDRGRELLDELLSEGLLDVAG